MIRKWSAFGTFTRNSDSIAEKSLDCLDVNQVPLQLLRFCDSAGVFEGGDGFFGAGGGGGWVERRDEGHPEQAGAGVVVVMDGEQGATDDEFRAGALPFVEFSDTLHPESRFGRADGFRMQQTNSPQLGFCQLLESGAGAGLQRLQNSGGSCFVRWILQ